MGPKTIQCEKIKFQNQLEGDMSPEEFSSDDENLI